MAMTKKFLREYTRAWLPPGTTPREAEDQIVAAVQPIAARLGAIFRFGYYTCEDMESWAWQFLMEAIEDGSYDAARPLPNFAAIHMHHRLYNLKRNEYCRPDSTDKRGWNTAKQTLMRCLGITPTRERACEDSAQAALEVCDLMALIDENLDVALRGDYLRMLDGERIPESRRTAVREAIRHALNGTTPAAGPTPEPRGEYTDVHSTTNASAAAPSHAGTAAAREEVTANGHAAEE